jgi:ABC-2 type transport system ATP-binding protein
MELIIEQLTKQYGKTTNALNQINLTLGAGIFGLLGPNGAGKSTLMQIIATIIPKTSGTVKLGGYVLGKDDQAIRQLLGYLPQEFGLYKKLTGEEFLDYIAIMKGIINTNQRKQQVAAMLESVNLSQQARKKIGGYSGGMKQRIGIAQALLGDPRLIVVDEPTAGLDPEERIRFRNVLDQLAKDRIILLSTHIVSDIESSCEKLAIIKKGSMLFQGTRDELIAHTQGRVWTGTCSEDEARLLKASHNIVSTKLVNHSQVLRIIADAAPFSGAIQDQATLEDGYMLFTGGMERA